MGAKKFKLKFNRAKVLSENVHHFVFEFLESDALIFKAGQFISLHLASDGKEQRRNYSLANSPGQSNTIEFACSYIPGGLASTRLWNLTPGDIIDASGPYGMLVLPEQPLSRYILVATGTGVTPYRSMLPDLIELIKNNVSQVVLLQGVRTRKDLLYKEEFTSMMQQYPQFIFKACYSREENADDLQDFEYHGYVQDHLTDLQIHPEQDLAYLCGNPLMVDAAFEKLQSLGLDKKSIKREKYISSK